MKCFLVLIFLFNIQFSVWSDCQPGYCDVKTFLVTPPSGTTVPPKTTTVEQCKKSICIVKMTRPSGITMNQTGVLIADNLVLTSMHGFIRKDYKDGTNGDVNDIISDPNSVKVAFGFYDGTVDAIPSSSWQDVAVGGLDPLPDKKWLIDVPIDRDFIVLTLKNLQPISNVALLKNYQWVDAAEMPFFLHHEGGLKMLISYNWNEKAPSIFMPPKSDDDKISFAGWQYGGFEGSSGGGFFWSQRQSNNPASNPMDGALLGIFTKWGSGLNGTIASRGTRIESVFDWKNGSTIAKYRAGFSFSLPINNSVFDVQQGDIGVPASGSLDAYKYGSKHKVFNYIWFDYGKPCGYGKQSTSFSVVPLITGTAPKGNYKIRITMLASVTCRTIGTGTYPNCTDGTVDPTLVIGDKAWGSSTNNYVSLITNSFPGDVEVVLKDNNVLGPQQKTLISLSYTDFWNTTFSRIAHQTDNDCIAYSDTITFESSEYILLNPNSSNYNANLQILVNANLRSNSGTYDFVHGLSVHKISLEYVDQDNDNIPWTDDNCPYDPNPPSDWVDIKGNQHYNEQPDYNLNGIGDACDGVFNEPDLKETFYQNNIISGKVPFLATPGLQNSGGVLSSWSVNWGDGTSETFIPVNYPYDHVNFGKSHTYNNAGYFTAVVSANGKKGVTKTMTYAVNACNQLPAAPTLLSASAITATSLTLSWKDNSSNEVGFIIEQLSGTTWSKIGQVDKNVTSLPPINNLKPNTNYQFRVYAWNACGNSNPVSVSVTTLILPIPLTPTNPSVSILGLNNDVWSVMVSFSNPANNNEDGFNVNMVDETNGYSGSDPNHPYGKGVTSRTLLFGSLSQIFPNDHVHFEIQAYNQSGTSGTVITPSITFSAPPTPINFNAGSNYNGILLTWTDNADNENGFTISWVPTDGGSTSTKTIGSNQTSTVISGLGAGVSYDFKISAFNALGTSSQSKKITIKAPGPPYPNNTCTFVGAATDWTSGQFYGYTIDWCDGTTESKTGLQTIYVGKTFTHKYLKPGVYFPYVVITYYVIPGINLTDTKRFKNPGIVRPSIIPILNLLLGD